MKKPTLMFVWAYDKFPYCCMGEGNISSIQESGWVKFPNNSSWSGFSFRHVAELPIEQGRKFQEEIKNIESKRNEAIKDLEDLYNHRLQAIFSKYGITKIKAT